MQDIQYYFPSLRVDTRDLDEEKEKRGKECKHYFPSLQVNN